MLEEIENWAANLQSVVTAAIPESLYAGRAYMEELAMAKLGEDYEYVTIDIEGDRLSLGVDDWLMNKYEGDLEYILQETNKYMAEFIDMRMDQQL